MPELIPVAYESLDERFDIMGDDYLERLWQGGRWTEGPAYFPAGKYLLFSDIPNDRVMRYDETDGSVSVYSQGLGAFTNGRTVDRQGRVVTCEQGTRRVTRVEADGSTTVLAERWNGARFNSPNDVVVSNDDAVWFTDPPYGIASDYQGFKGEEEIGGWHVYRIDPLSGEVAAVATDFIRPNGLAFSPDESLLYIADSRRKHIRVFNVDGAKLTGGDVFADIVDAGNPDGVRVDSDGRVWVATHEGLHVFHTDGTLIGKFRVPEPATSNLTFGGPQRNLVYITAGAGLYVFRVTVNGAAKP